MRIVWQDTHKTEYKSYRYRKHTIIKIKKGWITDVAGDDNIYSSSDIAHNAIDEMLGWDTSKPTPRRHRLGIRIVGKKTDETE